MSPSQAEAQGLERVSKYPKSTKYGRQNPITARWNSEERLVFWREAWADTINRFLERAGSQERVDHRNHAERGLDEQPTIHEGVIARALEAKGIISDRCELNRQIKADNALLQALKAQIKKLTELVKGGVAVIAGVMENLRQRMIVFRYQVLHIGAEKTRLSGTLQAVHLDLKQYEKVINQLRMKHKERKTLLDEKSSLSALEVLRHRELAQKITTLTEDIEELKNEKALLLHQLGCLDAKGMETVKQKVSSMEISVQKFDQQEAKYMEELDAALAQFDELRQQAADMDAMELNTARQAMRTEKEQAAVQSLCTAHGKRLNSQMLMQSRKDIAVLLDEAAEPISIRQQLQQEKQTQQPARKHQKHHQER